jgi:hypothetical protein
MATQQQAETEMTDKQLAETEMTDKQLEELKSLEALADANERAAQARRMEQAMRAVNEVSKQHNRTAMTYGINKQR